MVNALYLLAAIVVQHILDEIILVKQPLAGGIANGGDHLPQGRGQPGTLGWGVVPAEVAENGFRAVLFQVAQAPGGFHGAEMGVNVEVLVDVQHRLICCQVFGIGAAGQLGAELGFRLPEDLPPATEAEKKALFAEFIAKTRSNFDTLPVQTRKVAMQNLYGALPPTYTVREIMDRLMEAIDKSSSEEQKVLIVDKVGMVFNEHGWTSITNGHEHHHHGDDCDCGCHDHHHHEHHHHHGHDCGCGHDHHDHDHHHHH